MNTSIANARFEVEGISLNRLAGLPRWICWRLESPSEPGRPWRKVPYWINGRTRGWSKPAGWGTRAQAEAGLKRLLTGGHDGGVGIVLGPIAEGAVLVLAGLDLDTCIDSSGGIAEWAQTELDALDSYAEVSPSKTGVKAYFLVRSADVPGLLKAFGNAPDAKALTVGHKWSRGNGHHPPAIELYLGARWFAVTGERLLDWPKRLATVPADILSALIEERGPTFAAAGNGNTWKGKTLMGRSERAMGLAARIKRNGASQEDFEETLGEDPELAGWRADHDQRQLNRAWERAGQGDGLSDMEGFGLNEDGVAQAFAARHRDQLRFDHTSGKWHVWDGCHWKREETRLAFDWARKICRELRLLNAADSAARALATRRTAEAVEKFAQADRAFAVSGDIWDRDLWLLGTPAGTVDLRTGELRPARQEDFITKVTSVAPVADFWDVIHCPRWQRFLKEATRGDAEFIRYLQQWAGYCLTGDVSEHALLFIYGPGGNGKTVWQSTIFWILGDYACAAPTEMFSASKFDRHPTELARLRGARLVTASETEEGRAWAENRIKYLTGGDRIPARFMNRDFFEFDPTHKLTLIGNNKPRLRNVEQSERRRFKLAPFEHKPKTVDSNLAEELRKEGAEILAWAILGCLDWQRNGFIVPLVVAEATEEYFTEQDVFGQWLASSCKQDNRLTATASDLYQSYSEYVRAQGERESSQVWFAQKLQKRGFQKAKNSKGNIYYKGLGLHDGFAEDDNDL